MQKSDAVIQQLAVPFSARTELLAQTTQSPLSQLSYAIQ